MHKTSGFLADRRAAIFAVMLFAGLLLTAPGVHAKGFTIEQALSYPFPYGLIAAKHGERIAWVFNLRGARNVWVADGPDFTGRH
jgi:hypothetical protein